MINRILFIFILIAGGSFIQLKAQYTGGVTYPEPTHQLITDMQDDAFLLGTTISASDLKAHLSVLASDAFEGRETGYPGVDKAADYINDYFMRFNLPKIGDDESYFQKVAFTFSSWETIELKSAEKTYRQLRDFVAFPQHSETLKDDDVASFTFGGYGIDDPSYSDYANDEADNAVRMVYDGEPVDEEGNSLLTKDTTMSEWTADWQKKSRTAKSRGIKLLLIVSNDLKKIINENRRLMVNTITELGDATVDAPEGANTMFISTTMAKELLGSFQEDVISRRDRVNLLKSPFVPVNIPRELAVNQTVKKRVLAGKNMLGYVEGTDNKDELIILSAHYDHVGKKGDSIFNGADDNGSGTTAVLEILETLVTAKKLGKGPRRSVLCMLVTGEEKGLLGSQYYVENPIFPIHKTVANVNIDMVGRVDEKYGEEDRPYIYVIGSDRLSWDLHDIDERVNADYTGLILDYKYNDESDPNRFYYRSDHYNFARKGIPAIFYFNGVHADYHRATDTVEKINFSLMEARTRLIFHTVWELANRKERIRLLDGVSMN